MSNDNSYDSSKHTQLKKSIALTNTELLQLTYNDEKFFAKLAQLNHRGVELIQGQSFGEGAIYLGQAERILEYAASCGKTIERALITTILNNEACIYQRTWQLKKSVSYIEAIIFNITEFLQSHLKPASFSEMQLSPNSPAYIEYCTYLERKLALSTYHLQYCAVSSQDKCNEAAYGSALKAVGLLSSLCGQIAKWEEETLRNNDKIEAKEEKSISRGVLNELARMNDEWVIDQSKASYDKCLAFTTHHIRSYLTRSSSSAFPELPAYSIGHLMQLSPIELPARPPVAPPQSFIQIQTTPLAKIFKVIYMSMGYFTMATQLRLISGSKHTLDQQQRKASKQFKESICWHLLAIGIAAKHLPCQSIYFDHIINSFKNHYALDLLHISTTNNHKSNTHQNAQEANEQNHAQNNPCNFSVDSSEDQAEILDHSNKTTKIHQNQKNSELPIGGILRTEGKGRFGEEKDQEEKEKKAKTGKVRSVKGHHQKVTTLQSTKAAENTKEKRHHGSSTSRKKKEKSNSQMKSNPKVSFMQISRSKKSTEHLKTLKKQIKPQVPQSRSRSKKVNLSKKKKLKDTHKQQKNAHAKIQEQYGFKQHPLPKKPTSIHANYTQTLAHIIHKERKGKPARNSHHAQLDQNYTMKTAKSPSPASKIKGKAGPRSPSGEGGHKREKKANKAYF